MDNEKVLGYTGDLNAEMIQLCANPNNKDVVINIKQTLNKIFEGADCKDVICTENTDKLLFGMIVYPIFTNEEIMDIMTSDKEMQITKYKVEIDSKIFSKLYGLDFNEVSSLLLHEVGALVYDKSPIRNCRYLIEQYITDSDIVLKISDYASYIDLSGFAIKEIIRHNISIFDVDRYQDSDVSETDKLFGIDSCLFTAIGKLRNFSDIWCDCNSAEIMVKWFIRVYNDVLTYRIQTMRALTRSIELTASVFERIEMKKVIKRLTLIDDHSLIQQEANSMFIPAVSDAVKRFKYNGIKNYFNDLYDIQFEVNNLDDDRGTAIMLLHKINSRMAVIDDYLNSEEDLSAQEIKKLQSLYSKYDELRFALSSRKLKSPKTLVIDYGDDD